jgi:hypothetical protein
MKKSSHAPKIKTFILIIINWCNGFGIDFHRFLIAVKIFPAALIDFITIKDQNGKNNKKWNIQFNFPNFSDKEDAGGTTSGHYFYQDLLVARKVFLSEPIKHFDVGSRIDGFVAHVAVFRPIEVLDIRPVLCSIPNLIFRQCNIQDLPEDLFECCDSLSCLHALEHFGLGRYKDPIDINGFESGFNNLVKMLIPNGVLYLSVPIGNERIEFNAHRVFAINTILELAKAQLQLIDFAYVDDIGNLHEGIDINSLDIENNYFLTYGCGIFEFRKKANLQNL